MMCTRTLAIGALAVVLLPHGLEGQDFTRYRAFELGSELAAVSALTGASTTNTIHARPALLQELAWRPARWLAGSMSASTDPVEQIVFSFYNNRLFRVVVDYGYERTAGMTDADMVAAITGVYGTPLAAVPDAVGVASRADSESGSPVRRWGDAEHSVVLYRRSSYRTTFRLVVTAPALEDLARKAAAEAVQLDAQEAPAREIARQQKAQEDGRAADEKARTANKGTFRP